MIRGFPTLGVQFDIAKLDQESGYGFAAWKIFWRAIEPGMIPNADLFAGDTRNDVCCIAIQSFDIESIERVKVALGANEKFRQVAASPSFTEESALPLVPAGSIDPTGNVVAGQTYNSRAALRSVRKERAAEA